MRKLFALFSVIVLASLLAACGGGIAPISTAVPSTQTARVVTATPEATVVETATSEPTKTSEPTLAPTATATLVPTLVPTATEVETLVSVDSTLVLANAPVSDGLRLQTAEDIRSFFKTATLKWVAGGKGLWVAGAQGSLVRPLVFAEMPEGMTAEIQCVQYHNFDGELVIKEVCAGAEPSFSKAIPAGTVLTVWLEWVVEGSESETWAEGFIDRPCLCADGDCRDE